MSGSAISCLQPETKVGQIGTKMVPQSRQQNGYQWFIILPACCGVISFKWDWISCGDCCLTLFECVCGCWHGVVLGETSLNMATWTLSICLAAMYKELMAKNVTSRKWRTEEWWLENWSTTWNWTLLCRRKYWFSDTRRFVVDCFSCLLPDKCRVAHIVVEDVIRRAVIYYCML